jgi:FKBP12-rapamycin complex-associated protein
MGQFENGYNLTQSLFEGLNDHERRKTAHWMTAAAWHMGDFDTMADYVAFHPKGTSKSLYKAIIDVHAGDYNSAFNHIAKAKSLSYDELQTQLSVGPSIAIKTLAKTEVLVELEEVINYKTQPDSRQHILNLWRQRFKRSHADANSWMKRLQVWTLACPATTIQLQNCFLDCAKLCESSGMNAAARRIIEWVTPEEHPPVSFLGADLNWFVCLIAGMQGGIHTIAL